MNALDRALFGSRSRPERFHRPRPRQRYSTTHYRGGGIGLDLMSLLFADTDRTTWRTQAACQAATAELFFPVGRTGDAVYQIEAAKNVCQTCPVRIACLRFALETNQEAGIW